MAEVSQIIGAIKNRKVQEAVRGLEHPLSKDAYELGRLAGVQQGLAISLEVVNEVVGKDEQEQSKAPSRKR